MEFCNKLTVSYVLDVIVLCAFAIIGGVFSIIPPSRRAFSLTDTSISFPYGPDTVSILTVFLAAIVAPAIIIAVICVVFVTRPPSDGIPVSKQMRWRRKLWELFTGLLGLAFATVLSFFLTQSMKNLFGKPRPDFLDRCNPDVNSMPQYTVGGFSSELLEGTSVHVSWGICKSKDGGGVGISEFNDGFRSFPSGHCNIAFAGLVYLSLFLATKFSVTIPFLAPAPFQEQTPHFNPSNIETTTAPLPQAAKTNPRSQSAAPPIHLFVIVFIPIGAAIYIASTRYTDYKHHGFDVLFSSIMGILSAWFCFRWYHMPIRRGAGWAWGPRSNDRAFGIGIGTGTYHVSKSNAASYRGKAATDPERDAQRGPRTTDEIELATIGTVNSSEGHSSRRHILGNRQS
ncbi:hypothetical protein GTA08_BOTSDO12361 [Neofusicoccum parvum]|uniref:Uncharacterized protein n=1 Tax=Neofusicoccum parvum TaxID=310453 RepID=A0ACB5RZ98_9PEZI|nr:hypothetical protein GTA08_BOTSDO12361 [Neofusicoccum parvum]